MLNVKMFTLNVVFLCLTVTVVFCENEHQKPKDFGLSPLVNCFLESNLTQAEFQKMVLSGSKSHSSTIPKTQTEKCFVDCMMRATNMIKNGKISVEVMTKSAVSFYGRNYWNGKLIFKRVEDMINGCAKKVSDELITEECAVAATAYTCMLQEALKAGLADQYGRPVAPKKKSFDEYVE